jgi:recombination protein RecR
MTALPPPLHKLVQLLARLPGVGERSAIRLAFHILSHGEQYPRDLSEALHEVVELLHFCEECHTLTERTVCASCADPARDQDTLCVVESIQDLMAFERTGVFRGLYHVLHGVLSPLKGIGPDELKLHNLESRITSRGVQEVIVATNPDVEGEATALFLSRRLAPLGVRVTRIATGVPMGGALEYVDQSTLARALDGRTEVG